MAAAATLDFVDRDHSIRHRLFPIGDPIETEPPCLTVFELSEAKYIWVLTLIF